MPQDGDEGRPADRYNHVGQAVEPLIELSKALPHFLEALVHAALEAIERVVVPAVCSKDSHTAALAEDPGHDYGGDDSKGAVKEDV